VLTPSPAEVPWDAGDLQGLAAFAQFFSRMGELVSVPQTGRGTDDGCLHWGYEEASRRLNVPEKWLRERIATLPHRKMGKYVQFTEDDLRRISDMHFVQPTAVDSNRDTAPAVAIRPSQRSRRR